jgi:uncharacterized protein (DUF362 family)
LEPKIYKNQGVLWSGDDTLELDAVVSAHMGIDPDDVGYLKLAAQNFGDWDNASVNLAKEHSLTRFP